jgi:hypothetical protein
LDGDELFFGRKWPIDLPDIEYAGGGVGVVGIEGRRNVGEGYFGVTLS